MKHSKYAIISMLVISAVFCLSIFINNIHLPQKAKQVDQLNVSDNKTAKTKAVAKATQDNDIQSFSYDTGELNAFNADESANSSDVDLEADTESEQKDDSNPVDLDDSMNKNSDQQSNDSNDNNKDNVKDNSVDEAKKEVEEKQQESKYANIGISTAKDFVYIRKEPSTDGEVLGKLYRGSAATILKASYGWYYVESGSVTGYIKSDFLKTGLSDDELVSKYGSLNILVHVDGLNVRKGTSLKSKKLTVVYRDEKYPVLKTDGDWLLINIEDENVKGYVKKELTDLIVDFKDAVSKEEEQKTLQLQAEERAQKEIEVKHDDGVNYSAEDLKLLACLIHSEAGSQSYECKLAVANIVLNRVQSSKYPDSIRAVIYQNGQFTVAATGSLQKQLDIYDSWSSQSQLLSLKAARDALEGANNIGSRLYFHSYGVAAKKGYTSNSDSVKIGALLLW